MKPIHTVWIDGTDKSGMTFGIDDVTPVTWIFRNSKPKNGILPYSLEPYSDNEHTQKWIRENNKTVVMSFYELRAKLLSLAKEGK